MPKYLIDVNLPYHFPLWTTPDFIHQKDIDAIASDNQIWNYAKKYDLIIISKDKDFSVKQLVLGAPPKLIHIRIGNVRLKELFTILTSSWQNIEHFISDHNLVNV